jgi:tetratricopeptide (TPR) repeat protein
MLGQLMVLKKDDAAALELFKKAVALNPKLKDAQVNLGALYLQLGDFDNAIIAYQQTLAADANNTVAHYNLGALYMEKAENEKALFHFQQALKNPSSLIDMQAAEKYITGLKAKQAAKETP